MTSIPNDYVQKVYAGWLGKVIGVRLGAPIEGWTYEKIRKTLGKPDGYIVDYNDFASDDDTNGPVFFLRAVEDYGFDATVEQHGLTLLNYVPCEHGFFWWGGYGCSTEHTAYLNLKAGISAPRSGSIDQNGIILAEQIGGQIFSDIWGLIAPCNKELAAELARKSASVSHDGNGVFGGMFIAACVSVAFSQSNILRIIEGGLSVIPEDCEYACMVRDVMNFFLEFPYSWEKCFDFIKENYGYDRYPGVCHIIPNSSIIILSLLFGGGDFTRTLNICNMCGWDTDCNVGNVGAIMGVRGGIDSIDYSKWIKPIKDFLACGSVVGSRNITNLPSTALWISKLGYALADKTIPAKWESSMKDEYLFTFELPRSTHGLRIKSEDGNTIEAGIVNSDEAAYDGERSLKIFAKAGGAACGVKVFYKTYYEPDDFHDGRGNPVFSPLFYPGQTFSVMAMVPDNIDGGVVAAAYVNDRNSGCDIDSPQLVELIKGEWKEVSFTLPPQKGVLIREVGLKFRSRKSGAVITAYIDNFRFGGKANYGIDFSKEHIEALKGRHHKDVSQFAYLKGYWTLENGVLSASSCDYAEAYTGHHNFSNYRFTATILPQLGDEHGILLRVQGAVRSYAVKLIKEGLLTVEKNNNGYKIVAQAQFEWKLGEEYTFMVEAIDNKILIFYMGKVLLEYIDNDAPYLTGQIGAIVTRGSHCHYKDFLLTEI